jgi:hypothetical protein
VTSSDPSARVAGVMVVHNEWPLLAVTATNLLMHHVDRLTVYDHASTDGTMEGLTRLQRHWGDRLVVRQLGNVPFLQAAIVTTALVELAFEPFDWIYVADADEIALANERRLGDVLAGVPEHIGLVRYDVDNWIAPTTFDTVRTVDLACITARAVVEPATAHVADQLGPHIVSGEFNFFSVPFGSKVLVRNGRSVWLAPGAHFAGDAVAPDEMTFAAGEFSVAHVPFLSFDRLARRVEASDSLRSLGMSTTHGWQSHLVAEAAHSGSLESFWVRHSIGADGSGPLHTVDNRLSRTVESALKEIAEHPGLLDPPVEPVSVPVASATTARALVSLHELQRSLRSQISLREEQLEGKSAEIAWLRGVLADFERFRESVTAERATDEDRIRVLETELRKVLSSKTWTWGRRLRRVARLGRT